MDEWGCFLGFVVMASAISILFRHSLTFYSQVLLKSSGIERAYSSHFLLRLIMSPMMLTRKYPPGECRLIFPVDRIEVFLISGNDP
jgi:hypothetical protein